MHFDKANMTAAQPVKRQEALDPVIGRRLNELRQVVVT